MAILSLMEKAEELIESNKRKESKHINIFEWGAGNYVISIHLPRSLEQLANADEAIKKGYVPYSQPNIWSIGRGKWRSEQRKGFSKGKMRYLADLVLDEIDILGMNGPNKNIVAYVPSGKGWSDSSVNEHLIIAMQFYKKLKK